MSLLDSDINFPGHEHPLISSDVTCFCNICFNHLKSGTKHFRCSKCDFDICMECFEGDSNCLGQNSFISFQNLQESFEMINHIKHSDEIHLPSPSMQDCIVHSYPTFHLYEEQNEDPHFLIQATRSYIDSKGNHVFFFSTTQANKIIHICKESVDAFVGNHSVRLSMHCCYPILKAVREQTEINRFDLTARSLSAGFFTGLTFYIGYGIHKAFFSKLFLNALSGARFVNFISNAAKDYKMGCIIHLTNDFHIFPCGEEGDLLKMVPDHNTNIDWSQIQSLPIVLVMINEIKKIYPNSVLHNDHQKLNLIYSLTDYLEEGISTMMQNPLFANENDQKVISFVNYSIKSLQMFLRLKPKPFTILHTTHLQVYQADFGGEYHAFLSKEQLKSLLCHLVVDIRESLTLLADTGDVYPFDPQNLKDPLSFIKSFIVKKEVQVAEFYNDITQRIMGITKRIAKALIMLISKDFRKIIHYVKGNFEEQNNHLSDIAYFNSKHKNDVENIISLSIKKKIIPDLYSKNLNDITAELANLKHLNLLINIAGEMKRRLNDDFGFFHTDIKIVPCVDCIQKYEINIIV